MLTASVFPHVQCYLKPDVALIGVKFKLYSVCCWSSRIVYCVLDNSAFSGVQKRVEGSFRLFIQFAVFIYRQLQNVLPDNALGDISYWDTF